MNADKELAENGKQQTAMTNQTGKRQTAKKAVHASLPFFRLPFDWSLRFAVCRFLGISAKRF